VKIVSTEPAAVDREVASARAASGAIGSAVGDEKSSQFHVLHGDTSRIWAIAIGTRDVAHALRLHNRFATTPIEVTA
jgi:hypothetical protein